MAEKTPISILNEMMSKIKSTIVYEFCSNEPNTNPSVFTCKVSCDGVAALGSGNSKKDAKQNAAKTMLEKISNRTVIMEPLASQPPLQSTDATVAHTTIQELKKLCAKYQFDEPVFKELDSTGLPHSRSFNVQCTVSSLSEVGTATSKKQAKTDAANKMIKRIQDTFAVNNLLCKEPTKTTKKIDKSEDFGNNVFKSTNKKSSGEPAKLKINYGFKPLTERKELMENSQNLVSALLPKVECLHDLVEEFQKAINEKNVNKLKEEFQIMLESVNIDFHHMLLETASPKTYMLIIQLNTTPDILEMSLGASRGEAELRTIKKVIESLKELLK